MAATDSCAHACTTTPPQALACHCQPIRWTPACQNYVADHGGPHDEPSRYAIRDEREQQDGNFGKKAPQQTWGGVQQEGTVYAYRPMHHTLTALSPHVGIACDVHETTHSRHAEEIVRALDEQQIATLDGIIAVGGDGLFHEIVNGLLALRAAWDGTPHGDVATNLRLGHIPAGSTDTVAYTLHGTRSITTAAIRIVLGDRNPLDIARVDMLQSHTHTFAVSMISYGYLGDLMKVCEGVVVQGV